MERLVDLEIKSKLPVELLSNSQHEYMNGRSTETALHEVVSLIENGIENKHCLDVKGAFIIMSNQSFMKILLTGFITC